MLQIIQKIQQKMCEKRILGFSKKCAQTYIYSPYPISVYEDYVVRIKKNENFKIISFDQVLDGTKTNFIFRHDLDTTQCLKQSMNLVELHVKYSIPLSVYIRMDGMDYPEHASYPIVSQYPKDISLGLHSSCYVHSKPFEALRIEIEKFQNIYGFSPKFLTLHGLGKFKYEARLKLIKDISESYIDFGFEFADFIPHLRRYDYVIQDCHLNNEKRFLKKDIQISPPQIKGSCYLFLAHPCYWE